MTSCFLEDTPGAGRTPPRAARRDRHSITRSSTSSNDRLTALSPSERIATLAMTQEHMRPPSTDPTS
jgi:hypothetical protein